MWWVWQGLSCKVNPSDSSYWRETLQMWWVWQGLSRKVNPFKSLDSSYWRETLQMWWVWQRPLLTAQTSGDIRKYIQDRNYLNVIYATKSSAEVNTLLVIRAFFWRETLQIWWVWKSLRSKSTSSTSQESSCWRETFKMWWVWQVLQSEFTAYKSLQNTYRETFQMFQVWKILYSGISTH